MDQKPIADLPTEAERSAVDGVLGAPTASADVGNGHVAAGGRADRERRHLLLPTLHAVQSAIGWISPGALGYVCRRLSVPPAEAYGVASFYAMFSLEPRPAAVVHVCDDIACAVGDGESVTGHIERIWGPERTPSVEGAHMWVRSPCLGQCEHGSAAFVQRAGQHDVGLAPVPASMEWSEPGSLDTEGPPPGAPRTWTPEARQDVRLLRRVGEVDPSSLDDYRAHGGFDALRVAVELGPEGVIREVKDAKLLGRGGAAFPTGVKWESVAQQAATPHFFVCNADESEPGTFKDRVLIEQDPFALIEALTVAGFATGSEQGFVYLRGEYPLAAKRLQYTIDECRAQGLLGGDVMGLGFSFDVELRRGAGAYIAGEETALFNSIEGKRPEPRNKPPFPVTHGLFGKPTGINNVETLVNVLEILRVGARAYAEIGTADSTGTRLFCLSGHVSRPGVYEVEFGTTLGELLALAGGLRDRSRSLQAVLLGGAAGSFVGPDLLDLPLTFEAVRAAGTTLGSGVVMVFDDTVDLEAIVLRIARFFRDESCGQCVPCRVGTVRQEEALQRLRSGRTLGTREDELARLNDIAAAMRDASICGLGQTAASAALSAIERFDLFAGATAP
jgi:NADH-quinone oxidoreductase subunit F